MLKLPSVPLKELRKMPFEEATFEELRQAKTEEPKIKLIPAFQENLRKKAEEIIKEN